MAEVYSTTNEANGNILDKIKEKINGTTPDSGVVYVNKRGEVALALKYKNKCYIKSYDSDVKQSKDENCLVPIDYLMVVDETNGENQKVFNSEITKEQIEKIITVSTNEVPNDVLGSFDVSENQNGSIMAWYKDEDNNGLYELYIGQEGGVKANPNSKKLFNYYINVTSMDLNNLDTSNVIDMGLTFNFCKSLAKLDLSNFDTSNVTTMRAMFQHCENLINLDLSNFNTSKVSLMRYMFSNCIKLTNLNIKNFDTSNVTDMRAMFNYCESLTSLDLSGFITSRVMDMGGMFVKCSSLEELNLENFNTDNVETMYGMFDNCSKIKILNLNNFSTSKLLDSSFLFSNTTNLKTIKMNKADFTKVTTYTNMFTSSGITEITVKDESAKTFIESRLNEASITNTIVEIG